MGVFAFNEFEIPFSRFFSNFISIFWVKINSKYFIEVNFDKIPLIKL